MVVELTYGLELRVSRDSSGRSHTCDPADAGVYIYRQVMEGVACLFVRTSSLMSADRLESNVWIPNQLKTS